MSHRLILYDTSNYTDYPVGGQLTSIRNFLRYMGEEHADHAQDVLLVGICRNAEDIGTFGAVRVGGADFPFLAVAQAPEALSSVGHSLRKDFLMGLLRYRKAIGIRRSDCNYLHTPEAFLAVQFACPGAVCCVLSHGTYIGIGERARFGNPLVRRIFDWYALWVIRLCRKVFVLDKACERDYAPYNSHVVRIGNTIVCRPFRERIREDGAPVRFLYAGRLSGPKEKNIGPIVEAVKGYHKDSVLTLLGDGEARQELEDLADGSARIVFRGAVKPDEVQREMERQDILVLNSVSEGMPMVILEALCSGLPVITTDVGGIPDVLTYGTDSEVTDGTAESIRAAADRITGDAAAYARYSRAAWETSLQYDYRKGNARIFGELNEELGW